VGPPPASQQSSGRHAKRLPADEGRAAVLSRRAPGPISCPKGCPRPPLELLGKPSNPGAPPNMLVGMSDDSMTDTDTDTDTDEAPDYGGDTSDQPSDEMLAAAASDGDYAGTDTSYLPDQSGDWGQGGADLTMPYGGAFGGDGMYDEEEEEAEDEEREEEDEEREEEDEERREEDQERRDDEDEDDEDDEEEDEEREEEDEEREEEDEEREEEDDVEMYYDSADD
jgi:hypothetical protein